MEGGTPPLEPIRNTKYNTRENGSILWRDASRKPHGWSFGPHYITLTVDWWNYSPCNGSIGETIGDCFLGATLFAGWKIKTKRYLGVYFGDSSGLLYSSHTYKTYQNVTTGFPLSWLCRPTSFQFYCHDWRSLIDCFFLYIERATRQSCVDYTNGRLTIVVIVLFMMFLSFSKRFFLKTLI